MYDIDNLNRFYSTALGIIACRKIRAVIHYLWSDLHTYSKIGESTVVLGIGYAFPYLIPFSSNSRSDDILPVAITPSAQAGIKYKNNINTVVYEEAHIPLEDSSVDRIILVHSLEYAENQLKFMREIWRILAPEGRIIAVVPNRMSIWARVENVPFGHGRPFSEHQLETLLRESMFVPMNTKKTLFMPPVKSHAVLHALASLEFTVSSIGKTILKTCGFLKITPPGGGVLIIEAKKQIYGLHNDGLQQRYKKERIIYTTAMNKE